MKNKTKIILSLILVVSISLGAFLWNNQLQNYSDTPAEFDLSPLDFFNNKNSSNINPLTGLVMDKKMVNARPVAIMINNLHSGQPLLGVCDADIMYECPTEGGITRILAVFKLWLYFLLKTYPSAIPPIAPLDKNVIIIKW